MLVSNGQAHTSRLPHRRSRCSGRSGRSTWSGRRGACEVRRHDPCTRPRLRPARSDSRAGEAGLSAYRSTARRQSPPVIQRLVRRSPRRRTSSPASSRTWPSSGRPATCSPSRSPGSGAGRTSPRSTSSAGRSPEAPLHVRPGRRRLPQALRRSESVGPLEERARRTGERRSASSSSGSTNRPASRSGRSRGSAPASPARSTSTPSATTPASSGSGPGSCRGRSSSTRAGEDASLSTVSTRKAGCRTRRTPSRQPA